MFAQGPEAATASVMTPNLKNPIAELKNDRLSREVYTIPDLWREWTVSLAVGLPSMNSTAAKALAGAPRKSASTTTRKVIIDEVRRCATTYGEAQAVARMDEERLAAKASLDKVSDAEGG
jgi:hypothetical protein